MMTPIATFTVSKQKVLKIMVFNKSLICLIRACSKPMRPSDKNPYMTLSIYNMTFFDIFIYNMTSFDKPQPSFNVFVINGLLKTSPIFA